MTPSAAPICQLRVASTTDDSIAAFIRHRSLEIGQPLTFDEKYAGITALEACASALAADIINGLRLRARRQRVEIRQVEAVVKVWLCNPLAFLQVVGEEGDPSIESVQMHLYVSTFDPEAVVERLFRETLGRSPLYLTLSKAANVLVNFEIAI